MEQTVEYADVMALFNTGPSLVCLVDGIRVRIPKVLIQSGSEVWRDGDVGKLVIPKWLAISVGLRCTPPGGGARTVRSLARVPRKLWLIVRRDRRPPRAK